MIDVRHELTESFYYAELWCLEGTELYPDETWLGVTARAFERLQGSVTTIPPSLMLEAEELATAAGPAKFEATLQAEIERAVGQRPFPGNAAEFLGALVLALRSVVGDNAGLVRPS